MKQVVIKVSTLQIEGEDLPFRQLLNSFKYGILAIDFKQNIFFCNESFFSLMKIKQNIIGKPLKEVFKEENLIKILNTGQSQLMEKFTYNNRMFLVNRIPIHENGEIVGAVSTFMEITSIEKITFEIAKTFKKQITVNTVIDAVNYGILILDKNGMVCKVNNSLLRDTELTSSDFLRKDMDMLFKQGLIRCNSIALTSLNKKQIVTDFQGICTGKELIINAAPIVNEKGEVLTVASTVKDITDFNKIRLELEEAFWLPNLYKSNIVGGNPWEEKLKKEKIFITRNIKMLDTLKLIKKIANSHSKVLILGESGVGKEIIVENIHKWSLRQGRLIKINCSAIPEKLLESELFGYEEGAFTGAKKRGKPGAFEMANNGTLFLDEIGDLPLSMQAKILRVLEDTKILRLGGTEPIHVNARIIAATNQNLKDKTKKGEFREDLYYRLNVLPIFILPLRERTEDIPLLLIFYLGKYNGRYQLQKSFSPATVNILTKYSWPGNVRELKNVVERMVIISNGDVIRESDIPDNILDEVKSTKDNATSSSITFEFDYSNMSLKKATEELEKIILENAIKKHGSFRKASKHLGVSHTSVIKKVKKYGITN